MICEEMGFAVPRFPEDTVIATYERGYLDELHSSHLLVWIATRRSPAVEAELQTAQELGIPILEFTERGRRRQYREMPRSRFAGNFESLHELREKLRAALARFVYERFTSGYALETLGGRDIYDRAAQASRSVSTRLGMVQETGTILLGPRRDRLVPEKAFLDALQKLILRSAKRADVRVIYVLHADATRAELKKNPSKYPGSADALAWLRKHEDVIRSSSTVTIGAASGQLSAAVVHDSSIEMAMTLHGRYYVWLNEVGRAANDLWEMMQTLARESDPLWALLA